MILLSVLACLSTKGKINETENLSGESTLTVVDKEPRIEDERTAKKLLKEIVPLVQSFSGDQDELAKIQQNLTTIRTNHGTTKTAEKVQALERSFSIIGKEIYGNWGLEPIIGEWVYDSKAITVVLFWELWCPHCKQELQLIEDSVEPYKDQVDLIGVTRMSNDVQKQDVFEYFEENPVQYPIMKENGVLSSYYFIPNIPQIILIKDNAVVWRGHPDRVDEELLQGFVEED